MQCFQGQNTAYSNRSRVDPTDEMSVWFIAFLLRLRDGNCTVEDWETIVKKCSKDSVLPGEWKRRGFEEDDVVHLCRQNKDVVAKNNE